MKKDKKVFLFIEVVLAMLVVCMIVLMTQEKGHKPKGKISVILQNSDDAQWAAFKYGIKMAAQDQGMEAFLVSTGGFLNVEEQKKVIETEIKNGADALIVQPAFGAEKMLQKEKEKAPIVLIERTKNEEAQKVTLPVVEPEYYAMGKALAKEIQLDYNNNLQGKTFGLFSESEQSEAVYHARRGFLEQMQESNITILWSSDQALEKEKTIALEQKPKVDVVVAFDDSSLTMAGTYVKDGNLHGAVLYGIGNSTQAFYYLDTRIVKCFIVSDQFQNGYQSFVEIAKHLNNRFYPIQDRTISYHVVRKDTIFSEENQDILFAMSQ